MAVLYITHPRQLLGVASDQTICMPVALLEERTPFFGVREIERRIKQRNRIHDDTTTVIRKG